MKTISRTRKHVFYVVLIFPNIKNLHYRSKASCLLVIPRKAMSLAKTAGKVNLVLYCGIGCVCVYVRAHICLEDGVRVGLYAWYGKDAVEF